MSPFVTSECIIIVLVTIFRLRTDFDDANNTKLIGAHGYCSQVIKIMNSLLNHE